MSRTMIYCPICGFELWPQGMEATEVMMCFDICPCCGCEFGVDDTPAYREAWIAAGSTFHSAQHEPAGWDPEAQLRRADYTWHNPFAN